MQSEKTYNLTGCFVTVYFEPQLIRIIGSEQLLNYLKGGLNKRTLQLIKLIKADYLILIGNPLKITNDSLMLEIWGHLYASKFAGIVKELIRLKLIENLTGHIKNRSDTIDCGEVEIDSNRKFWDTLAKFKSIVRKSI